MMDKRDRKIENIDGGFEVFGNKNSDTLIVGWGSTKSSILEYLAINPEVKYIHIWRPWPFAADLKKEVLKAKKVIVIENNFSGQMASLIEMKTLKPVLRITKDDGRPFYKEELAKLIDQSI
jgi:2-oxoglutarate ferredoxin oxidoreductase subunit alpha